MHQDLIKFQDELGHRFLTIDFLEEALRHSSYVNELPNHTIRDNERLEFLGDAVLNLVIGDLLMKKYPHMKEGDLSRMRAGLVNESELAKIAERLHLGDHLRLGKGEAQTNGQEKPSILADGLEAVIAAVYLDSGFAVVYKVLSALFWNLLEEIAVSTIPLDYKSRLQEMVQLKEKVTPQYRLVDETGPDHDKTFIAEIIVGDMKARGTGKSKKAAEQQAARHALDILETP